MRILKRHFFVRSLVAILLSSTSLAVWAEFDNVVVNGAAIDAAEFQRYKDLSAICIPYTYKGVFALTLCIGNFMRNLSKKNVNWCNFQPNFMYIFRKWVCFCKTIL